MSEYQFHAIANLFPLLQGDDFESFADNIETDGLQHEILLFEGMILDGRNRYRGCKRAGVPPRFTQFQGTYEEAVWFVLRENLHRRHLDFQARADAAKGAVQLIRADAAKRQAATIPAAGQKGFQRGASVGVSGAPHCDTGKTADVAAKLAGVSAASVKRSMKVDAKATPELKAAVKAKKVSLSKAAKLADLPAEEQLERLRTAGEAALDRQEKAERKDALTQCAEHVGVALKMRKRLEKARRRVLGVDGTEKLQGILESALEEVGRLMAEG